MAIFKEGVTEGAGTEETLPKILFNPNTSPFSFSLSFSPLLLVLLFLLLALLLLTVMGSLSLFSAFSPFSFNGNDEVEEDDFKEGKLPVEEETPEHLLSTPPRHPLIFFVVCRCVCLFVCLWIYTFIF